MLKKGQVEAQASGSVYDSGSDVSSNIGFKLGVGLTNKFNMKLRYELMNQGYSFSIFGDRYSSNYNSSFIELDLKFGTQFEKFSFSIPFGYYTEEVFQFDPRIYFSFVKTERFDITVIPKCHIYGLGRESIIPGISLGTGISSKNKSFSFRAEAGIDQISLSGGMAISYRFGKKDQ
jgi:hypothetical protein